MNYRNNFKKKELMIKDEDKPNERQMKAENYLKEYDIQNILTEMINYLLHKRSKNPILEMIKYLGGLLTEKEREKYEIKIPSPDIDYHPLIDFPKYNNECDSLLKEFLDMDIFISLKDSISKYGTNLGSLMSINNILPKNKFGIMLADADCLKKFRSLYLPIICKAHNLEKNELKFFTENNFNLNNLKFDDIKKNNLDDIKGIKKITISISRNIIDEPFITFLNVENRNENILNKLDKELKKIKYFKNAYMKPVEGDDKKILSEINYDLDFFEAINTKDNLVQKYRKIYVNEKYNSVILINFCDNFQFIKNIYFNKENESNNINSIYLSANDLFIKAYNDLNDFVRNLQYYIGYEFDHNFGYLTSNLSLLGTGFNIKTEINLNELCGDKFNQDKIKNILNGFDKYSDNYVLKNIDNDKNILIFGSSPKISHASMAEFINEYFEKILKLKSN